MSNRITSPFGAIPSDWIYISVIEHVNFLTGPAFDSSKFNMERNGPRLVRGINLTRGTTRWSEDKTKYWNYNLNELEKFQLVEKDILIGMDGSLVGKNYAYLRKSDLPAILVQRVARLRVKPQLDSKYFYYMFGTDYWLDYVETVKTNSGIPHISNGDIKNFRFPFPPLPEQQKIAAILTSVDNVIEKTQAQIDKLKDLKTGMMQELLTRGIGVGGKPHSEFKDSPVGRIPKSWNIEILINLSSNGIKNGTFNDPKKVGKGYKLINVVNMYRGFGIDINSLKLLDADEKDFFKNKVEYGDVFFTRSSLKLEGIAYCNINLSRDDDITYDGHLMCIRPDCNRVLPKYLTYYCLSDYSRKYFMSTAKHSTMTTIGQADIAPLQVLIPPLDEQQKIIEYIDSIESNIRKKDLKLAKYISTKKALMQDLLTGKVRVKVDS